jgi:GntR family transcriptional regulator
VPKRAPEPAAEEIAGINILVDREDAMCLHDQVAAAIRKSIAEGEVAPGDRIPPAVDLAAVLGVNKNTVFRALRILRDEGIVDFTRGRGVRVTGTPQRSAVVAKVTELLDFAREQGYRRHELVELIEQLP